MLFLTAAGSSHEPNPTPVLHHIDDIGEKRPPLDFADYLLARDFVVEAVVEQAVLAGNPEFLELAAKRVVLGSIVHERLILATAGVSGGALPGDRVLAWGGWSKSRGDTCSGSALTIHDNGRLSDWMAFKLHGKPLSEKGTYERLVSELARRERSHVCAWLASGTAVGIAAITGEAVSKQLLQLSPGRVLVGDSQSRWPRYLRWIDQPGCVQAPLIGDSLLISLTTSTPDTLVADACLSRADMRRPQPNGWRPPYTSPFGLALQDLGKALIVEGDQLRLKRISEE